MSNDDIMEKNGGKKFDIVLMNPPYGNLHLKFLEKAIKISDNVISIQPVRWLQDTLAETKKSSDYNKYKNSISEHINHIEILNQSKTDSLFNIQFNSRIAIFVCDKNGGFDYNSIRDNEHYKLFKKIIEKTIIPKITFYKNSDKNNFVPICDFGGHVTVNEYGASDINFSRDRYKYFINNKCQCDRFKGQTPEQCKSYNLKTFDNVYVVEFDTGNEAKNFYNYICLKGFKYFVKKNASDGHINIKHLPFVDNYKKTWTNKEFCEYFNISGYISDNRAEKNSDWEKIINVMKYWENIELGRKSKK